MGKTIRQIALPACVVLLGVAALVYGARYRSVPVSEEKEREELVAVPAPFGADMWDDPAAPSIPSPTAGADDSPAGDEANPFGAPADAAPTPGGEENPFDAAGNAAGLPPMRFEKIKEMYEETLDEPEWLIVREVTFGGVVRLANGQLKRTYSGQPPALCPT